MNSGRSDVYAEAIAARTAFMMETEIGYGPKKSVQSASMRGKYGMEVSALFKWGIAVSAESMV